VAGEDYAFAQLVAAFVTAASHPDEGTRERALRRAGLWQRVVDGMAIGLLNIGSPRPVAGLPTWVTLQVVRGGFATGGAQAGGPVTALESELAGMAGSPAQVRAACFDHCLTEGGLARLWSLLDSDLYRVDMPEAAALLTVAWLVRAGQVEPALALVDVLRPLSARLRFVPVLSDRPELDPSVAWRRSAGQVSEALAARRHGRQIAAMLESLTVWSPFGDEVLAHWLATRDATGQVGVTMPPGWHAASLVLLRRYERLAGEHQLASKHRRPKENLCALLVGLRGATEAGRLGEGQLHQMRHAADSMITRRGEPGSVQHAALRARQAADASRATWTGLARLLTDRLSDSDPTRGLDDPDTFTVPVTEAEADRSAVRAGTRLPAPFVRAVEATREATIPALAAAGVVPSAEELARLVPHLTAGTIAAIYPDPASRRLVGATYRSFRQRRSLLLLNLAHQARFTDLPWISAISDSAMDDTDAGSVAAATLAQLGQLVLDIAPSTLVPNRLVSEFSTLADQAGLSALFTEELAADIFEGTFTFKYQRAAQVAATVIAGSLYSRYYGINDTELPSLPAPNRRSNGRYEPANQFADLCHRRAGIRIARSVAANGAVIEQSQILTTHNLAALVATVPVQPSDGWTAAAATALRTTLTLLRRARTSDRPLRTLKDAAYAWRQAVFYLSQVSELTAAESIATARARSLRTPTVAGVVHAALLDDLQQALTQSSPPTWQPFYGWVTGDRHSILDALKAGSES